MTIIARDVTLYSCVGNVYILWDKFYVLREKLSIKKIVYNGVSECWCNIRLSPFTVADFSIISSMLQDI